MSSDNGVYILHTKDGYRVAHLQAIENLYFNCGRTFKDPQVNAMINMFGDKKVISEYLEAFSEAVKIEEEIGWTEYGVRILNHSDIEFPKEKIPEPKEKVWYEAEIKIESIVKEVNNGDFSQIKTLGFLVEIKKDTNSIFFRENDPDKVWEKIKKEVYLK